MIEAARLQPGDVVAVRGAGFTAAMIRFGAVLLGKPNLSNHVAIFDHWTGKIPWFIEGRPGGVGWRDGRDYLASGWTIANTEQPKTAMQRSAVLSAMQAALKVPYDWDAIAKDAADAVHLPGLFASEKWGTAVPGHVVCSSLAAWGYARNGLAYPKAHGDDPAETTPGDWDEFILTEAW